MNFHFNPRSKEDERIACRNTMKLNSMLGTLEELSISDDSLLCLCPVICLAYTAVSRLGVGDVVNEGLLPLNHLLTMDGINTGVESLSSS